MARTHAELRLAERYGVRRNGAGVIGATRDLILAGEAKFRRPMNGGRSEWEVYVAGRRLRVCWEEASQTVVTVLPWWRRRPRDVREGGAGSGGGR